MENMLYESQKKQVVKSEIKTLTKNMKEELDDLLLNAIILDSRSFNDFRKKGIEKFLQKLRPEYKPPNRATLAKRLRLK